MSKKSKQTLRVYEGDDLLVLGGLNAELITKLGLKMDTFRYDPVLISIYFSCKACPFDTMEVFGDYIPVDKQFLMQNRVMELGIPWTESRQVLYGCYRCKIARGTEYRFERDGTGVEEIVFADDEEYFIA